MATPAAVLSILVKADTKAAQAGLVKMDRGLKTTAGRMDGMDKSAKRSQRSFAAIKTGAVAAGGGLVLAGLAAKKAFREFEEAEKATSQTRAVLKSTGNQAKVTAAEIENLAQKLSLKSGIDDEAIQSGENLLLTFTKIRNETGKGNNIFTQATSVILDMSVALGQDLKGSTIQVGKALQDPVKGLTALRRVGVNFNEQQSERVANWVEEGKQLKAQKFILRELRTEFEGSAEAQARGSEKLKVAFDNVFEAFGKAFGPTVERGMEKVATALEKVGSIISDPKLTNAEKFGRVMDMVVAQIEKALPKVAEAGGKVGGVLAAAVAKGVLKAWTDMSPLAKMFTIGALIRVVGGRGALLAAGTAIGKLLGGGIAAGTAAGMGGAAAGGAGGAAAGGIAGGLAGLLAKGKVIAGRLGWAGLGIIVAERITSAISQGIKDKGAQSIGSAMEQVRKQAGGGSGAGGVIESIFGKSDQSKRATDLAKALDQIQKSQKGIGHERAEELRKELGLLGGVSDTAKKKLRGLIDSEEEVGRKTKWLQERFKDMRTGASRSVEELKNKVSYNTKLIREAMGTDTKRGKEAMVENLRSAARNARKSINSGAIGVKEGTALIRGYLIEAWTTMGFSKGDAIALMKRTKGSAQTPMGGELRPNQRGSYISGGKPVGDSIPSVLERGEYVLNRNAVKKVGKGNLDNLNFRSAPRFQKGGMAGMVAAANQLERAQFPYLWGGGHSATPAPFGPMDCSGAVSYVLQHGGVNIPTMTSGSMMGIGQPGSGKVTVYANPGHVLMRIGNRFFGTSGSNPGGGAGWIDPPPDSGYLSAFTQRSFDPSGMAGGMFTGEVPKIPKVELSGPDGLVKGVAQGALNVTRKVAQAGVNKVAAQMAPIGAGDAGDPGLTTGVSGPNVSMGKQMAARMGWTGAAWDALKSLWQHESGWSETARNPSSGAYGIPQALPASKMGAAAQGSGPAAAKAQIAWGLNYIKGRYGDPSQAWAFWNAQSPHWYQKGGPVGYAGDSLGVGTAPALKNLFGDDRNVQAAVSGGKSPQWGLGALKGLGKKKSHYVFDFGSNKYGSVGIMQALRQAKQYVGDKLLHTFTLNAGETEANNKIRGFGGASVIDWANKHGALGDGLHGDYGHRARLVADSINKAAKTKQNKPKPHGKVKKRKQLHGLQAPGLNKLHNTVDALMHGDQAARTNALHGLLDHVQGTGLPKHLTDQIDGLTVQAEIAGDYADRLGQLTTEEGGVVFPGDIGGKTETMFLQEQLDALFALRNRLIAAHEAIAARREQIKKLRETAQKHLEFYAHAVTAWGHARKVKEKELERLKKKPKQNKEQIKQVKALLDVIDEDQVKRVRTRDALKNRIIPALDGKRGSLKTYADDTITSGLVEVQGAGSPMTRMATLPALGVLGGSILTTQVNMARLGATPSTTTTADTDIASERDDLLKEIGRLTLQRSAVEKLHEITLRDFPEFDRLGAPFGGKFHTGGIVPGPVGAEATTVLQGGEGVFTRDQMAAMGSPNVVISVAPGMEWLKQFISVEVGRTNRSVARNAGRGLPGQGGGRLR